MKPPVLLLSVFVFLYSSHSHAGVVWAWGDNTYGETNVPTGLTNTVAVSAGGDYCLALAIDGKVTAWGNNQYGRATVPSGLDEVVSISAGTDQNLALKADGTVVAFGADGNDVPANLRGVVAVSGGLVSLALKADGTVIAWPINSLFGLSEVPADLTNAIAISAHGMQCLALRADGTVTAWPVNGTYDPAVPQGLTNVIAVSAGWSHSLALLGNGSVIAWGDTNGGACDVPLDLTNAVAISAGDSFSLALKADGTVVSWGIGLQVPTPALSGVTAISAGLGPLAMGISSPGQAVNISFISPQTQTIAAGSQAFFSVGAYGASPLTYQWLFNGTNAIAGATNRWLALPNAQPDQSGQYSVIVSNSQGSMTSQAVSLDVATSLTMHMVPAIGLNGLVTNATYNIEYVDAITPTNAWTVLATITLTNNPEYYCDTSAIGQPTRIYRLVQVK